MVRDPNCCGICGQEPICLVRSYAHKPFIDGRKYPLLCFTCASVPKMWEFDTYLDRAVCYKQFSQYHLHSVEEMMEDGWSRHEAEFAIKSVKRLLQPIRFESPPILDRLFFPHEILVENLSDGSIQLKFE